MNHLLPFLQGRIARHCTLFIALLICSGCARPAGGCHWLYDYIPENRGDIAPYEGGRWALWALLGNDDDGIFGEKSSRFSGPPTLEKAVAWQMRNPLHNFCFYVIGTADRPNDEWDLIKVNRNGICLLHYHPIAHTVFAGPGSSFYLALHGGKPFISLRANGLIELYAGWRERGNFGIKLRLGRHSP